MLSSNTRLCRLVLRGNDLRDEGAAVIIAALCANRTLKMLSLVAAFFDVYVAYICVCVLCDV